MSIIKITGQVTKLSKAFQCQFSNELKRCITITQSDGAELKIYKKANNHVLMCLRVNSNVEVEINGTRKKIIPLDVPTMDLPAAQNVQSYDRLAVKESIKKHIKTFKYIYDSVANEFDDYSLNSEDIRTISTTVFIQQTKKFPSL